MPSSCAEIPESPLGVVDPQAEPLNPRQLARWTCALVLLGLAARVIRYLLVFPIWQDEAYLCANLIGRDYAGLLEPLAHHQVAPVLFLWTQKAAVDLLGFSEWSLRLVPLLASVAGLLLFWHVAAIVLRGTARLLAVGIFAVGYPLVRYACEAKPYGCDMLASLVLLALAVHWWRGRRAAWLVALAAAVPVALGLSYASVFTAGGISLAVALALWQQGPRRQWAGWAVYNLAMCGGFAAVYHFSTGPQSAAELAWMRDYWKDVFPPLGSVGGMIRWLVVVHTSELLQYPVGGARGASTLTTLCCAVALVWLWRRGQWVLVALCAAPLLPNFAAALLWRYPYGGSVRFVLYLAPMVCLLAGLGAAVILVRRDASGRVRGCRAVLLVCGLLALVAVGSIGRDFAYPYRTRDVLRVRDFARWFWFTQEYDAEVISWETDVPEGAGSPVLGSPCAAIYVCNREIYSPRRRRGEPARPARVTAARPLRCVRWSASNVPSDDEAFGAWLAEMQSRYALAAHNRYAFPMHYKDRDLDYTATLDLYEFVPHTPPAAH